MNNKEIIFYAELTRILRLWDGWLSSCLRSQAGPATVHDDIVTVSHLSEQQKECVRRLAKYILQNGLSSLMASLDGVSDMSDSIVLQLVDSDGNLLSDDLLNGFVEYLLDVGEFI